MRDRCRASNEYLDFLHGNYADQIDIKIDEQLKIDFEICENEMNYLIDDKPKKYNLVISLSDYQNKLE